MSDTSAVAEPSAEITDKIQESTSPETIARYGTMSVAYFPKQVKLEDGKTFVAHDLSIRRGYKVGNEWKHVSMTIKRREAMQFITALEDCYRDSYAAQAEGDEE